MVVERLLVLGADGDRAIVCAAGAGAAASLDDQLA